MDQGGLGGRVVHERQAVGGWAVNDRGAREICIGSRWPIRTQRLTTTSEEEAKAQEIGGDDR
jgi:hypothetical protein